MSCRAFTSLAGSFTGFLRCERGGGTIMGLLWFFLLVGITGLAIDITNALRTETILQATADAASHAGVQDLSRAAVVGLSDADAPAAVAAAINSAQAYATKNMPFDKHGAVLNAEDVQVAVWDPATRTLMLESGLTPNAVLVTLRRTAANGNALALNFLRIAGLFLTTGALSDWDITAQSVSMISINSCLIDGFVAAQWVLSGSNNDYVKDLCIHGQEGVKIGSSNSFGPGVGVTMFDPATFIQGNGNLGIENALGARNYLPPLPPLVRTIVEKMMDQTLNLPDYLVEGLPVVEIDVLPGDLSTLSPEIFYVVKELADFGSDANIDGLQIMSLEAIVIGSNSTITNTLLVSPGNIVFGSNVVFSNVMMGSISSILGGSHNVYGSSSYCDDRVGEVQMFAVENIELGSFSEYSGVQIVSAQTVNLGTDIVSLVGISVQAGQDIIWENAARYDTCSAPHSYNPENAVYIVN